LLGLDSDIWVLLLFVVIFHCLLPWFHPIGWLGALLLSLVSMLSHSFRLLGVLGRGKFLILGSTYPRRFSAPEENAGFDLQCCGFFNKHPFFQKSTVYVSHDLVDFLLLFFLITGHGSLFGLWLSLQFRHC
jgi:hypothetical protein